MVRLGSDALVDATKSLATSLDELRTLAVGLHPGLAAGTQLEPAISALAARSPVPTRVNAAALPVLPDAVRTALLSHAERRSPTALRRVPIQGRSGRTQATQDYLARDRQPIALRAAATKFHDGRDILQQRRHLLEHDRRPARP
jgi:hypothetical protein